MRQKYLIWGTGQRAENNLKRMYLAGLNESIDIVGFVDNVLTQQIFHGRKVYAPEDISTLDYDFIDIWVAEEGYKEIKTQINTIGISDDKITSVFISFLQKIFINICPLQIWKLNLF